MNLFEFDANHRAQGYSSIAGLDEAGRGPWAGPVVAAAVVLPADLHIPGLNDSKKLTPLQRERLFDQVRSRALAFGVGTVDQDVIDALNILQATNLAMKQALDALGIPVNLVLVDGCLAVPGIGLPQKTVIGGDGLSASIAAASVIAKVTRDRLMTDLSSRYPEYAFDRHKGYGTKEHHEALRRHGPCPLHRKSFAPIRKCIEERAAAGTL